MEVTRKPHLHRDWIDPHAMGIVKALQKNGHLTYLVGGCVRDLLLGIHPKDYDIATAAHPPQVKRLIYNSYIIGRRFRLVLVKRDDQQFEVATFRKEVRAEDFPEGDAPPGDNVFGTPEEDAFRRDFTVNGLLYDPVGDQIIDHVGGLADVEKRMLRMIGDPKARLAEDSIRILRGLRLSHKLGLTIEPELRQAFQDCSVELQTSVLPRRREEILKFLRLADPAAALLEAYDLGILQQITPTLAGFLSDANRLDHFLEALAEYRPLVDGTHAGINEIGLGESKDPTLLFAWLVVAFFTASQSVASSEEAASRTLEHDVFQNFMQNELGMFKLEQTVITKALELRPVLENVDEFRRRGERRQVAFAKNEGFVLALALALADYALDINKTRFWLSILERARATSVDEDTDPRAAKRRPRRRRRRPDSERSTGLASDRGESDAGASTTANSSGDGHAHATPSGALP